MAVPGLESRVGDPGGNEAAHTQETTRRPHCREECADHASGIRLMPWSPEQSGGEEGKGIGQYDLTHEVEPLRHSKQMPLEGDGRHHQEAEQRDDT